MNQFPVPEGWFSFGTHVDCRVPLEFSEEVGEDGLPWWERPMTESTESAETLRHRDALIDTHEAYTQFHGWVLDCAWCDFKAVGKAKAEALRQMQRHYDLVLPEGVEIR